MENAIEVEVFVNESLGKVWDCWTNPKHICGWNFASDDWCCPKAENDLRVGGKFSARMEAKDGSTGFDFEGIYDELKTNSLIKYTMEDGRQVKVEFEQLGELTRVVETFEAEVENSREMQKSGWQAILNNFKKYSENVI